MYLIFASGKIQHLRSPFEPPSHVDSGRADPAQLEKAGFSRARAFLEPLHDPAGNKRHPMRSLPTWITL